MPIEQVDREAVQGYFHSGKSRDILEHFAAHRIAAEQRGREQERAAVVAYLHAIAPTEQYIRDVAYLIADRIKDGEHLT